jgi:hypothetical protein
MFHRIPLLPDAADFVSGAAIGQEERKEGREDKSEE